MGTIKQCGWMCWPVYAARVQRGGSMPFLFRLVNKQEFLIDCCIYIVPLALTLFFGTGSLKEKPIRFCFFRLIARWVNNIYFINILLSEFEPWNLPVYPFSLMSRNTIFSNTLISRLLVCSHICSKLRKLSSCAGRLSHAKSAACVPARHDQRLYVLIIKP